MLWFVASFISVPAGIQEKLDIIMRDYDVQVVSYVSLVTNLQAALSVCQTVLFIIKANV